MAVRQRVSGQIIVPEAKTEAEGASCVSERSMTKGSRTRPQKGWHLFRKRWHLLRGCGTKPSQGMSDILVAAARLLH